MLCSISTFTACSDGDEDPIVEIPDGDKDDGKDDIAGLNGKYEDKTLKMIYNGEELTGKRVNFTADEKLEKATIVLSGVEKDITDMLGGIISVKFTTNSPVPGEKEIKLENVALSASTDGSTYSFEGKDENSNRTMLYKGTVKNGEMSIDITNSLVKQELAGTWNLAPIQNMLGCTEASPLWLDWDSKVKIDPGTIPNGDSTISGLDNDPNGLFSLLFFVGEDMFAQMYGFELKIQQTIAHLLQSVTVQPNGCMYATYSYSNDLNNPAWSNEMSRNIIRYYYGDKPGQIYIEANADFILNAIGGLLTRTRAEDQDLAQLAKPLIEALRPALEEGFPCTYDVNGDKIKISLDGEFTLKVLKELVTLINDPNINTLIMYLIEQDETLAPYADNVKLLLSTLPNALMYKDDSHTEPCEYVKVGFQLVKASE